MPALGRQIEASLVYEANYQTLKTKQRDPVPEIPAPQDPNVYVFRGTEHSPLVSEYQTQQWPNWVEPR